MKKSLEKGIQKPGKKPKSKTIFFYFHYVEHFELKYYDNLQQHRDSQTFKKMGFWFFSP